MRIKLPPNYAPLTDPTAQIRLLDLLPGTGRSRIRCRLRTVDIGSSEKHSYEPLSYCWGSQSSIWTIIWVGDNQVHVGKNLYLALEYLRFPQDIRTLWVDALCINQQDVNEKNAQIPLMRQIYENGSQTLVWLGDREASSALAFQIMNFLASYAKEHPGQVINPERWDEYRRNKRTPGQDEARRGAGPLNVWASWNQLSAQDALRKLFGRAWFERVWVIQEVAVSEKVMVHCGNLTTSWENLQSAYGVSSSQLDPDGTLENLITQRMAYRSSRDNRNLASIACFAAMARATDPRDKIYALLGLVESETQASLVAVDYEIDAAEVYKRFTRRHLQEFKDPGILAHSIGCRDRDVPSWTFRTFLEDADVPHYGLFGWNPKATFNQEKPRFQSSKSSACLPVFEDNGQLLGIHGYEIGTITVAASAVTEPQKSELRGELDNLDLSDLITYLDWRDAAGADTEATYPGSTESMADALRSVIYSVISQDVTEDHYRAFLRCEAFILERFKSIASEKVRPSSGLTRLRVTMKSLQLNYSRAFGLTDFDIRDIPCSFLPCLNRRLIKTETGHLGLAPRDAEIGDVVVLIAGSPAPFILRKAGSCYKIVGDCYLHGVMNGEAWDENKCQTLWIE